MGTSILIKLKDRSIENADKADIFLDGLEASKKLTSKAEDEVDDVMESNEIKPVNNSEFSKSAIYDEDLQKTFASGTLF